jgi:phage gpG-like protein
MVGLKGFSGIKAGQTSQAMPFTITMIPTPLILVGQMDGLAVSMKTFRKPLEESVKKVVIPSIKENFDVAGRPAWDELSPWTLVSRGDISWIGDPGAANVYGQEILVRTGKLRRSAVAFARWQFDRERAWVGNDFPPSAWYGPIQQQGYIGGFGAETPSRPFMMIQDEDVPKIEKVFLKWIQKNLVVAGFRPGAL